MSLFLLCEPLLIVRLLPSPAEDEVVEEPKEKSVVKLVDFVVLFICKFDPPRCLKTATLFSVTSLVLLLLVSDCDPSSITVEYCVGSDSGISRIPFPFTSLFKTSTGSEDSLAISCSRRSIPIQKYKELYNL